MSDSIYTPIKPWQIRLFQLEPGTQEDLHGTLKIADIVDGFDGAILGLEQQQVSFDAISYNLGPAVYTDCVWIDHTKPAVTPTLGQALRALRTSNSEMPLYLWANALCINQHDIEEKSIQVQKMFIIYSKAAATLVWLGPADKCTDLAVDHLNRLYANNQKSAIDAEGRSSSTIAVSADTDGAFLPTHHLTRSSNGDEYNAEPT
jgi:hypothetical protein